MVPPPMDISLTELQEMASRQQQQINAQQQVLASKVHLVSADHEKNECKEHRH